MVRSPTVNLRLMATSQNGNFPRLRRRRHGYLDRRPRQHLFVEGIELRIGLAPAAIGKAEIGIAEHAGERDLRDVERARQHLRLILEARHAAPPARPRRAPNDRPSRPASATAPAAPSARSGTAASNRACPAAWNARS